MLVFMAAGMNCWDARGDGIFDLTVAGTLCYWWGLYSGIYKQGPQKTSLLHGLSLWKRLSLQRSPIRPMSQRWCVMRRSRRWLYFSTVNALMNLGGFQRHYVQQYRRWNGIERLRWWRQRHVRRRRRQVRRHNWFRCRFGWYKCSVLLERTGTYTRLRVGFGLFGDGRSGRLRAFLVGWGSGHVRWSFGVFAFALQQRRRQVAGELLALHVSRLNQKKNIR